MGATVLLYWDADNNGVIEGPEWSAIRFMNTDANGNYLFDNLPPGNYLVDVYEDSITTDGVRDIVPTTPNVRDVDLTAGQDVDHGRLRLLHRRQGRGQRLLGRGSQRRAGRRRAERGAPAGERHGQHRLPGRRWRFGGGDDYSSSMDTGTLGQPDGHFKFLVPPGPCTLTYDQGDIATSLGDGTTPTSYIFTAQARRGLAPVVRLRRGQRRQDRRHRLERRERRRGGPNGNGAAPGLTTASRASAA